MAKIAPFALAGLLAPLMFGQFQTTSARTNGDTIEITLGSYNPQFMPQVTGMPYSADEVTENVQTLADGTHITQNPSVTHVWRDSQGRTRTERRYMRPPEVTVVELRDPVAGSFYVLDSYNKITHRLPIPTQPDPPRTGRSMPRIALTAPAKPSQTPSTATSTASEQLP